MSTNSLLQPPTNASPQHSQELSKQAPTYLQSQSSWLSSLPYPLNLFVKTESQEKWQIYENMFLASLRAGDNDMAFKYLQELIDRFGWTYDHVVSLHGLYLEAIAKDEKDLQEVLKTYQELLRDDPTRFSIQKRRAALLRSMGKNGEAIVALTTLLDSSPTDAEAWAELGDLYLTQGAYDQATHCFEEVLLVMPNAWNMHAKLGEVNYLSAGRAEGGGDQLKALSESMRRFCRSVELCDDYLRGYYGLKLTSNRLLEALSNSKKSQQATSDPLAGDIPPPTIESVKKLNELATAKLAEILRRSSSGEAGWDGYSEPELTAARELLDRDVPKVQR